MCPSVNVGRDLSWDQYEIALVRNNFRHGPCGFVVDDRARVAIRVNVLDSKRARIAFAIQARERILSRAVSRSDGVQEETDRLRVQSNAILYSEAALQRRLEDLGAIVSRYQSAARNGEGLTRLELDVAGVLSTVKALRRLGGQVRNAAYPANAMRAAL